MVDKHLSMCCQKRFTWRHDGRESYSASCVDTQKYTLYADIPGLQTNAGGTITPDILVTTSRPDLVIIDKRKKIFNAFELTVPYKHNESIRHTEKQNRYASMQTDITQYKANIVAFEIGALQRKKTDFKLSTHTAKRYQTEHI